MRELPHHPPGSGAKKRRYLPFMAVAGVIASIALAGCASENKHKWLTLFFDGVPSTNAPVAVKTTAAAKPGTISTNAAGKITVAAPAGPPMHKPYRDNNCEACHVSKFEVTMRGSMKQTCLSCHKTLLPAVNKVVHDPVGSGDCMSCHAPHYSTNKFLLTRSGKAVCADCHDPDIASPKSSHEPYENGECLSCHDPHSSTNKHLVLKTGAKLCFDCHDDFLAAAKFKHTPADNGECDSCHNPHASNSKALLLKDPPKLCDDCHEPKDMAAAKGHQNIGKAACLDCHDPHVGNDEYLLKAIKTVAKGPTG